MIPGKHARPFITGSFLSHHPGKSLLLLRHAADFRQIRASKVPTGLVDEQTGNGPPPFRLEVGDRLIVLGDTRRHAVMGQLFGDTRMEVIKSADRPSLLTH